MNQLFNESFLLRFNRLALPLVIVWSFVTAGSLFLSPVTTEHAVEKFEPFFEIFHFGKIFSIVQGDDVSVPTKTVTTTTLVPQPHRIEAIYRASSGSFVSISDLKENTVVALGGSYKKQFRLVGLSDTAAIFKSQGKSYRLRLGFDDNLYREEVITRTVADTSKGGGEAEWLSIPYQTVASQMRDIQNIGKKINISEVVSAGRITGFRVNSIASDSVFARIGLERGDVIESVNNHKMESYADAFNVYAQVPHMRSLRITVLRNNLQKDIVYEITR